MIARPLLSLLVSQTRYFSSLSRVVDAQISVWESHALAIPDPSLSALAVHKLRNESSHAAAAAMLATSVRRPSRSTVASAIVSLEVLYDYLDGRTENLPSSPDPLLEGSRLFEPFTSAFALPPAPRADEGEGEGPLLAAAPDPSDVAEDSEYMAELSRTVSEAFTHLPAARAVAHVAQLVALRAAQAQILMHAAPALGIAQLQEWATTEVRTTPECAAGVEWREFVVSSASAVLVLHALLAAAAEPSTSADDASRLAAAYSSVCVLLTLLDGIVDYDVDARAGPTPNGVKTTFADPIVAYTSGAGQEPDDTSALQARLRDAPEHDDSGSVVDDSAGGHGYIGLYSSARDVQDAMVNAARRASTLAPALPNPAFHTMLLTGVFAYYASAPGASNPFARPIISSVRRELGPLATPTLVALRSWRAARRRLGGASVPATVAPASNWRPQERRELS